MSLTINAKTFTADSFGSSAVGYVGPLKSVTIKDDVVLRRTAPKRTSEFSGVGRTSAKLTRTLSLTGVATPQGDAILEINASMPVGFTPADVDSVLNDMGAFLASAEFKSHVKAQKISF